MKFSPAMSSTWETHIPLGLTLQGQSQITADFPMLSESEDANPTWLVQSGGNASGTGAEDINWQWGQAGPSGGLSLWPIALLHMAPRYSPSLEKSHIEDGWVGIDKLQ